MDRRWRGHVSGLAALAAVAIPCAQAAAAEALPPAQAQIAALIASAPAPRYACLRQLYVDPVRGRSWTAYPHGGGGRGEPWKSIQDADHASDEGRPVLRAGDCVNLEPGVYPLTHGLSLTRGGDRNAPDGYVVYRSAQPGVARLVAAQPMYGMIDVKTAYVILDGLELDGNRATAAGEGVATSGNASHHHIVVEHCRIHDMGGGGVQLNDSEYFWVVGNDVYRNASTNRFQESGISVYQPQAAQGFTPTAADQIPFHIVIAGNRSHDNVETFACADGPGCHTDGNGVIIDKTKNVDRPGGQPYPGRTLVADNLVYGNGGGGIHLFLSEHVTAAGNVAVGDHVDVANSGTWRGELSNVDSDDTFWLGNVGWAKPGSGVLAHNTAVLAANSNRSAPHAVTWRANLTCGDAPSVSGLDPAQNRVGAPAQACQRAFSAARHLTAFAGGLPDRQTPGAG